MRKALAAGFSIATLALAGCGRDGPSADAAGASTTTASTPAPSTTASTAPSTTQTTAPTTTPITASSTTGTPPPPPVTMPSGDPVFAGYPKLVPLNSVDYRVAAWFEGKAPSGQLVALAPGVYTPYTPNVPDLTFYLDQPNSGDCATRDRYFPASGGACWTGVG